MINVSQQDFHKAKVRRRKQSRKKRDLNMINQQGLVDCVAGVPHPSRIDQVVTDLCEEFRSGGHDAADFDRVLFDQSCRDLREVPPAILEARELPPPFDVVLDPRFCVAQFNRRLIHANEDEQLIAEVEKTFARSGVTTRISEHSSVLGVLARSSVDHTRIFYRHVVCGRHRSALLLLRGKGPVDCMSMRQCLNLILMQTLLFNARDLQVNAALIYQAMTRPIPGLLEGVEGEIRLNAVNTVFTPALEDADLCLSHYKSPTTRMEEPKQRLQDSASGEQISRASEPDLEINLDEIEAKVRRRLSSVSGRDLVGLRKRLDVTVPALSNKLAEMSGPMASVPARILGATKAGERQWYIPNKRTAVATRYSGLKPSECLGVGVCRFVQSISFLGEAFDSLAERYESSGQLLPLSPEGLPAFDFKCLPHGSETQAKVLLDHYRRTVLPNTGFGCKSGRNEPIDRFNNQGAPAIRFAKNWLGELGRRKLMDFTGDINSERRTFHMLDVLPEVRLSR